MSLNQHETYCNFSRNITFEEAKVNEEYFHNNVHLMSCHVPGACYNTVNTRCSCCLVSMTEYKECSVKLLPCFLSESSGKFAPPILPYLLHSYPPLPPSFLTDLPLLPFLPMVYSVTFPSPCATSGKEFTLHDQCVLSCDLSCDMNCFQRYTIPRIVY